jgi:hypothetical protein
LNCGSGGANAGEKFRVISVDLFEVVNAIQATCAVDNVIQPGSDCLQNYANVIESQPGLFLDRFEHFAGARIHRLAVHRRQARPLGDQSVSRN